CEHNTCGDMCGRCCPGYLQKKWQATTAHNSFTCEYFTEGVNCNKCVFGYYRQDGVQWNDTMPCKPSSCDPSKHTGDCEEGTGKCYCQSRFQGNNCDQCAPGYYDPPECRKSKCAVDGTLDGTCLPENGQCPCKPGFGGTFCETCEPGFTNVTTGCK
ncbi:laminin EGF-like protein, partial [Teladorsagia circumcincta]